MGTPIHNLLYFGPVGVLFGQIEVDGRFFIHSIINEPGKPSGVKGCREVLSALEDQLRLRGMTEYYTMADSPGGFRFNELMGFETNLEVWNDEFEIMVKRL